MEYKGYVARVEFDETAGVFHGRVENIRDVVNFEPTNVDDLRREFEVSVDDYIAFCRQRGEEPEVPYSGKFIVRVDPALHGRVAAAAARAGKSINAWLTEVLAVASNPPSYEMPLTFEDVDVPRPKNKGQPAGRKSARGSHRSRKK